MAAAVLRHGAQSVTVQYTLGTPPEYLTHENFLAFPEGRVRDLLTAAYTSMPQLMDALSDAGMSISILWSRGETSGRGIFVLDESGFPNFEAAGSTSPTPELWAMVKFWLPYSASE